MSESRIVTQGKSKDYFENLAERCQTARYALEKRDSNATELLTELLVIPDDARQVVRDDVVHDAKAIRNVVLNRFIPILWGNLYNEVEYYNDSDIKVRREFYYHTHVLNAFINFCENSKIDVDPIARNLLFHHLYYYLEYRGRALTQLCDPLSTLSTRCLDIFRSKKPEDINWLKQSIKYIDDDFATFLAKYDLSIDLSGVNDYRKAAKQTLFPPKADGEDKSEPLSECASKLGFNKWVF